MRLEFDIGNTNHKWRLLDQDKVLNRGSFANDGEGLLGLQTEGVSEIWLSCVGKPTYVNRIVDWASALGCDVQQARVTAQANGVRCAYREPQRLGVDRWLVVLGAYARFGASCIVDIGSAMTVDVVDGQGQHLGGYIVPGYQLLLNALFNDTDKVRWLESEVTGELSLGQDTANAVSAGAKLMLLGFVEQALARLPAGQMQIVFTGGGSELLREHFADKGIWLDDLVFDGLALAQRERL